MTLVTIERVKALTGKTVDEELILQAEGMIETRTGIIIEQIAGLTPKQLSDGLVLGFTARDLRFLQNAIAYQAGWIADRPDTFDRDDADSVSQDGQSASLRDYSNTLAPNARLALRRLSGRGTRSTKIGSPALDVDEDERDGWGRPLNYRPMS